MMIINNHHLLIIIGSLVRRHRKFTLFKFKYFYYLVILSIIICAFTDFFDKIDCRHHRDDQRRGGHVEGDQILHPSDPGADRSSTEPSRGQQAHQLRGLPEGELRGHPGAMSHQSGEVSHGVLGPQRHLQSPQAGQRLLWVESFWFCSRDDVEPHRIQNAIRNTHLLFLELLSSLGF